jgi:hypothetical protein
LKLKDMPMCGGGLNAMFSIVVKGGQTMRVVEEKVIRRDAGQLTSGETDTKVKDYFDRVAKYVPAEIVAAYTSANGIAILSKHQAILFTAIFLICLVGTPIYITRFARTRKQRWYNGIIATVAFIVWAYATGLGLVKYMNWYDAPTASVILILFTVTSGFFFPKIWQDPSPPTVVPQSSPANPAGVRQ